MTGDATPLARTSVMESIGLVELAIRDQGAAALARVTVEREKRAALVERLKSELGVAELVYLATCNRVEIAYRERDGQRAVDRRRQLLRCLTGRDAGGDEPRRTLRGWLGEGAVEHLFLVASGLDSAQLGEREIQGQLRDALTTARQAGAAGSVLEVVNHPRLNHRMEVTAGVLDVECAALLREFFKGRRSRV